MHSCFFQRIGMVVGVAWLGWGVGWSCVADDWPQWRGVRRDGVSDEVGLLPVWPNGGPPLAWHALGLGQGYSSVSIQNRRLFSLGRLANSDVVVTALDLASHAIVWQRKIGATERNPCSTPTLDGSVLYALEPDGQLVCLQCATGEVVWQRHLVNDFGGQMMSGRGFGESPLVDGDALVCTPGAQDAVLVKLDKNTGAELWRARYESPGELGKDGAGFASVVVTQAAGIRQYVQLVGRGLVGVDAQSGNILWSYNDLANDIANIPTPIVDGDYVFAANGYSAGSVLVHLVTPQGDAASGKTVTAEVVYALTANQFQNHHGGCVKVGDKVLGGHGNNNGLPTLLDFRTGRVHWKRRGPGVGSAAVIFADQRAYFRYQNGLVALMTVAESGFEVKGTLAVPGAGTDSWAHPVISDGRLYLREQDHLWVYDIAGHAAEQVVGRSRDLPTELLAIESMLHDGGGSVEFWRDPIPLETDAGHGKHRRALHPYVHDENVPSTRAGIVWVSLTNSHLNADGTVRDDILKALLGTSQPLFLCLAGTQFSDFGTELLRSVLGTRLAALDLDLCGQITDTAMLNLASIPSLRVLIASGTGITSVGMEHLAAADRLAVLELEGCDGVDDRACSAMGRMTRLQVLSLKKSGFEKERITDAGLAQLGSLVRLEVLNLYGNSVTDHGLTVVQSWPNLRDVDLSLTRLTDDGLESLVDHGGIERLKLVYSDGFAGPSIRDQGLMVLARASKLRELDLTGARISDLGAASLASLQTLDTLRLTRTPISQASVANLRKALPHCDIVP